MNLEQIKSFVSVAETGSYTASTQERYVSQPAISSQIKSLEKELGVTLFRRANNKTVLTEQGQGLLQYAYQLLSVEGDMMASAKRFNEGYPGLLGIVAPWLTISKLMDDFFVEAIKLGKGSTICRVYQKEDADIPNSVLYGEAALGVANRVVENPNLAYEEAYTEEIVLITPNEEKYRDLTPAQLRELVLTEGHIRYDFGNGNDFLTNDFFGKVIGDDLHNIKTVANTSRYNMELAAVEAGLGIGFISTSCMQREWREGRVLAYRCKGLLHKTHYVVYDKKRIQNSKVLQDMKDLLVRCLKSSTQYPELSF